MTTIPFTGSAGSVLYITIKRKDARRNFLLNNGCSTKEILSLFNNGVLVKVYDNDGLYS